MSFYTTCLKSGRLVFDTLPSGSEEGCRLEPNSANFGFVSLFEIEMSILKKAVFLFLSEKYQ